MTTVTDEYDFASDLFQLLNRGLIEVEPELPGVGVGWARIWPTAAGRAAIAERTSESSEKSNLPRPRARRR